MAALSDRRPIPLIDLCEVSSAYLAPVLETGTATDGTQRILLSTPRAIRVTTLTPTANTQAAQVARLTTGAPQALSGLVVAVLILLAIIVPAMVSQVSALWQQIPAYKEQLQEFLNKHGMQATWTEILNNLPGPSAAMSSVLGVLQAVAGALGSIVTILLLPYYLLIEADSLEKTWLQFVSKDHRPAVARLTQNVTIKVGRWMGGQMLLCVTIGCTASIGLWFIGVPFFYVLGLIAAIGELVPIVGPLVAAIPSILVALTVSPKHAIFVVIYFSIQQFIEGSVLVPRIMERQVGVTAVTVILALLIGSELFGVVGALLAVPTAAIIQVILQEILAREHA